LRELATAARWFDRTAFKEKRRVSPISLGAFESSG
jgi:hypothetical protein